jgi:hypothetical protein
MPSTIGILSALVVAAFHAAPSQTPAPGFANGVCTESPHVSDRPPDDATASSFASPGATWFANDSRTLWAWWWGKTSGGDYKVLWVRPGRVLNVTGKRLDGESEPLRAWIPDGYYNTYQASGLDFPAAGCWQVDATASGQSLRFIVRIP